MNGDGYETRQVFSFMLLSVLLALTVHKTHLFFEKLTNQIFRLSYAQLICEPMQSKNKRLHVNGPFPSSCQSRFRSESWCLTIVREISLICIRIRNSFTFEWLCIRTCFETEACSNSEMGNCVNIVFAFEGFKVS